MIYFAHDRKRHLIKIGYSAMPLNRMTTLRQEFGHQKISLIGLCEGGYQEEAAYHARFARFRVLGEWFRPVPSILAEAARHTIPTDFDLRTESFNIRLPHQLARRLRAFAESESMVLTRVVTRFIELGLQGSPK